jgi:DtxR family Mn-dependent transcriptional regulator
MSKENSAADRLDDYLETILVLTREGGVARSRDIASRLGVKSPTVTVALRTLRDRGLIRYEPYEFASLTEAGEQRATSLLRKRELVSEFLEGVLMLSPEEAEAIARPIRGALPDKAADRLDKLVRYLQTCPDEMIRWNEDRFVCSKRAGSLACKLCEAASA